MKRFTQIFTPKTFTSGRDIYERAFPNRADWVPTDAIESALAIMAPADADDLAILNGFRIISYACRRDVKIAVKTKKSVTFVTSLGRFIPC